VRRLAEFRFVFPEHRAPLLSGRDPVAQAAVYAHLLPVPLAIRDEGEEFGVVAGGRNRDRGDRRGGECGCRADPPRRRDEMCACSQTSAAVLFAMIRLAIRLAP
jgi:hypothetical protein